MAYDQTTFDWHRDALASKADTTNASPYPPIFNDVPMTGTYAYRPSKNEPPKAVFFWYSAKTGELLCRINNQSTKFGLDIWPACSRHPISRAVYDAVIAGGQWPHEIRFDTADGRTESTLAAGLGHNSGDSDADLAALKGNIAEWVDRLKPAIKKGAPKTQVDADALADLSTKLGDLLTEAEKKRKAVTDPLYEAWKTEMANWSFIKESESYVANGHALVRAYLREEQKRRDAQARAINEEAAAQAAAAAPARVGPVAGPAVEAPAPVIPPTVQAIAPAAGTRKKVTTVKRKVVVFDDFQKAAAFFCTMDPVPKEVWEAIRDQAYKTLRADIAVPGAKLEIE